MVRLSFTVVDAANDDSANVVMEADEDTTIGVVSQHLASLFHDVGADDVAAARASGEQPGGTRLLELVTERRTPNGTALYVAGIQLDPSLTVAESPLVDGCIVGVADDVGGMGDSGEDLLQVRIAGGPTAGAVHNIGPGSHVVGSESPATLRLDDAMIPAEALLVGVSVDGSCEVTPLGDVVVGIEGEQIEGPTPWHETEQLTVGQHLLEWHFPVPPDAALLPSDDGVGLDYNRPPRLLPPEAETDFKLPSFPKEPDKKPLSWAASMMPVVMAVTMALVMQNPRYMLIGLFSPVMMYANFKSDKKHGKAAYKQQVADYKDRKKQIEQDAHDALQLDRELRRKDFPDAATTLLMAVGPSSRLWERRRTDPDYLVLRFGTAEMPSEVTLDDPEQLEHRRKITWTIPNAPVTIPINAAGVVGIAGRGDLPRSLARWAVAQITALHSPFDVQVVVLTDQSGKDAWEWTRWLPHLRPSMGQDTVTLLGTDADSVSRRVAELQAVIGARRTARGSTQADAVPPPGGEIVVILDGARRLRSLPGVIELLKEGAEYGVFTLCLDSEERMLPEECQAVVIEEHDGVRIQRQRTDVVRGAHPDVVSVAWTERLARHLSPIRDVSGGEEGANLPTSSRLLDVLHLDPPTGDAISARWGLGGRSTEAVIGDTYDGPFALDVRRDGPHGLIAGTTGAGKSELLQTIVAALAVVNRPDSMTFVLVDYKGGSAFKDCVDLPHTVGMVTDLDTHLVERALESLGAELKRREHILAESGAKDIEDYVDLLAKRPDLSPVPRLLIVIDEFASMARELPDFVSGLVNIAQRGRSLGIHLILATQRPSGVVSPEIRANTNLRIALRVTDPAESSDVIDSPDAARILKSTPGRAYARLGHASLVPFQAGRVGGRAPGVKAQVVVPPWITDLDWTQLGQSAPMRPKEKEDKGDVEITDLKVLVDAIRGANERMAIPPQHSPWLEALPDLLLLDDVPDGQAKTSLPSIPFGIEDIPGDQDQVPAVVDLADASHIYFVGAPRSGRSQILRTIAVSAAQRLSPADLHIHAIDCGNGALLALSSLPHCGVVAGRTQTERATRMLQRLNTEVVRRQELLAGGGYADITEQRQGQPDEALPHIMVLLDRWEGFTTGIGELDHGAYIDLVQRLMREGSSVGVHFLITGDRTLSSSRMGQLTEDKFAMRLVDKGDYSIFGINPRKVPDEMAAGRMFRAEKLTEVQVAVLGEDLSGQGQAARISAVGAELTERYADLPRSARPFRVELLPKTISYADALQRLDLDQPAPMWAMLGVGGDDVSALGPDLGSSACSFVIGGAPKSGRSTALLTLGVSYLSRGAHLILVTPRSSPLRTLAEHPGVVRSYEGTAIPELEFVAVVKKAPTPCVLLIDDAETLKDADIGTTLRNLLKTGGDTGHAVVAAGAGEDLAGGFSGWIPDMRRGRLGALLSPQNAAEADILGVRMSRSAFGGTVIPGRALVHLGDGQVITAQIPLTTVGDAPDPTPAPDPAPVAD